MAMEAADIAEFEKLLKKARQKELPFGLCLGKKPENNVVCLDLKKPPEVMMRKAKADGETGKITCGTCSVSGKIVTLKLQGKMLPGLAKNMKTFLIKSGIQMKVVIADPAGALLETDGEDEEEDAQLSKADTGHQPESQAKEAPPEEEEEVQAKEAPPQEEEEDVQAKEAAPEADPAAGQWEKVAASLAPLAKKFGESSDIRATKVSGAWDGAMAAAAKGQFKAALSVAAKLKPVLAAGPTATDGNSAKADPNEAKWGKLLDPMTALYTKAMGNNPAERTKIEAAWAMAQENAGGGAFDKAIAIVTRLKPLLDKAAAAATTGQQAEVPADVVQFQKSRVLWAATRKKMHEDMTKLEKAIADACAGDAELAEVAQNVGNLTKRLEGFDERLETILDQITGSPEGQARSDLKKAATKAVQDYQAMLQDPFFADVDANNGFVSVKVAASAQASLASIAKTLAA